MVPAVLMVVLEIQPVAVLNPRAIADGIFPRRLPMPRRAWANRP